MTETATRDRDRHEIIAVILDFLLLHGENGKTRIMQACNLKSSQINDFLPMLTTSFLAEKLSSPEGELYRITDGGRAYLKTWAELAKTIMDPRPPKKPFWRK